jgi:uncharacterized protein YndB with AHSA1/START domain
MEMARTEASVVINRTIDEVFAYLTDVRNWSQWAGFPEAEQTSEGSVGVGATFRGVSQFLGRRAEWTSEVTKYEPNKRMEQKITWGGMSIEQSLTFEPVEGGTRLTMVGEAETGGFFKLAEPVVNRMMQRQLEGNIANLKDILEAQA